MDTQVVLRLPRVCSVVWLMYFQMRVSYPIARATQLTCGTAKRKWELNSLLIPIPLDWQNCKRFLNMELVFHLIASTQWETQRPLLRTAMVSGLKSLHTMYSTTLDICTPTVKRFMISPKTPVALINMKCLVKEWETSLWDSSTVGMFQDLKDTTQHEVKYIISKAF